MPSNIRFTPSTISSKRVINFMLLSFREVYRKELEQSGPSDVELEDANVYSMREVVNETQGPRS